MEGLLEPQESETSLRSTASAITDHPTKGTKGEQCVSLIMEECELGKDTGKSSWVLEMVSTLFLLV